MRCKPIFINISVITLLINPFMLFGQQSEFPYSLKKTDVIIVGVGLSSKFYADYKESDERLMTYDELINLDKTDINKFDRSATNNWNTDLQDGSDWTRAVLITAPSILLLNQAIKKEWKNGITYGAMYLEVAIATIGITNLTKTIARRKRPYLYNSNISLSEKEEMINNKNVFDSFFSGHTSAAFASAVFFSKTYSDIYGKNTLSKVIWGSSLAIASATGYLRYKSGNHYPTDVMAGALVGSAIGYFIPVLHHNKSNTNSLNYWISGNSMSLTYTF